MNVYVEMQKNIPSKESELDRASMWKKARVDKKGQYDNEDVQEVVNLIVRYTLQFYVL